MRRLISATIACLSFFHAPIVAAADVAEEGKTLIHSMQAARQHLRSGVVRVRGVRDSFDPERSPPSYQLPYDADLAFDWPGGRLRYDAEIVERVASYDIEELAEAGDPADMLDDRETELLTAHMQSLLTPENYACRTWETRSDGSMKSVSNVGLLDANAGASVPLVTRHYCFDVRSVGLFNFWEFGGQTHVMGYQLPDVYFHLCDIEIAIEELLKWPVIAIERNGDLTTIRFRGDMTITLNESQGFTPVAYHDIRGTPHPDYINDTVASTVQWEQIDGVWVPTDFMIELLDAKQDGSVLRHTYTMEWSHVNQSVPKHYFDFKNFTDVPDQTPVYDLRSEEPALIGEWSGGQFVAIEPAEPVIPPVLAEPKGRPWNRLLVINSAILFLLLGGTLAVRLLRR